jgi:tetratricopeptide (TPR) repeat protein
MEGANVTGTLTEWAGDTGAVTAFCNAVQSRFPASNAIQVTLARTYLELGAHESALECADRTLSTRPDDVEALTVKSRVLVAARRLEEAANLLMEAVRSHPAQAVLARTLAGVLTSQQRYPEAIEAFLGANPPARLAEFIDELLPADPDDADDERKKLALLEAARKRVKGDPDLLRITQAAFRSLGRHVDALAVGDELLALRPDDEDAWAARVSSLRELHRHSEAFEAADLALRRIPGSKPVLAERGWLHLDERRWSEGVEDLLAAECLPELVEHVGAVRAKRFDDAVALVEAALARLPGDAALLLERARLHEGGHRFDDAIRDYQLIAKTGAEYLHLQALRRSCELLRMLRRFEIESRELDEGLTRFWYDVYLLNERGQLLLAQNRPDAAVKAFDAALEFDDDNIDALSWKVRALRLQRSAARGVNLPRFDAAIDAAVDKLPVGYRELERGYVLQDLGWLAEAAESFRRATDVREWEAGIARAEVLTQLGRVDEALQELQALRKTFPDDLYVISSLAWLRIERRELSEAEELFAAIEKIDPANTLPLNGRGAVAVEQGLHAKAERLFRKAAELEPWSAAFHSNLAYTLEQQVVPGMAAKDAERYLAEAEHRCRTALEIEPLMEDAWRGLGAIAFKRHDLLSSEEFLKRALEITPRGEANVDLGALYVQMGRYAPAKQLLEKRCEVAPRDARARTELGNLYLQTNAPKDAVQVFRDAVALNPQAEEAHRGLAQALIQTGNHDEAMQVLRRALREVPDARSWQLHLAVARTLTGLGDAADDSEIYEQALDEIRIATRLSPDQPEPHFHAGVVRFKLEDYGGARKAFARCQELDENYPDVERNLRRVRTLLLRDVLRTRWILYGGMALAAVWLCLLVALWIGYLWDSSKVTGTMLNVFSPLLLGMSVISFLLPSLTKLKLPGVEAEMAQPRERISRGPTGSVGFGSSRS